QDAADTVVEYLLRRHNQRARSLIEVIHLVIFLEEGAFVLIAHPEVERKVGKNFEIILNVSGIHPVSAIASPSRSGAGSLLGDAQQKISPGESGERSRELVSSKGRVRGGIRRVLVSPDIEANFQRVSPERQGNIIDEIVDHVRRRVVRDLSDGGESGDR